MKYKGREIKSRTEILEGVGKEKNFYPLYLLQAIFQGKIAGKRSDGRRVSHGAIWRPCSYSERWAVNRVMIAAMVTDIRNRKEQ